MSSRNQSGPPPQQQHGSGLPTSPALTPGNSPVRSTTPPAPASASEPEEGEWQVATTRKQQRRQQQRRRQHQRRQQERQSRVSSADAGSRPPSPAARPKAARVDGRTSNSSAAAAPRPPSPASKPAGELSIGGQGPSSGAAAKGPSNKPRRSYAAAAAKSAETGKENSDPGGSSSGAAKGAGRAPLAPLALPTNLEGAQHSGGSQHGQQLQRPPSNLTNPTRA